MRILHTSDLHIGIRVYDYSMFDEQRHVLSQIVEIAKQEKTDVTVIAGDIYDRAVGSDEAVGLFDSFLASLVQDARQKVFVISGNHDSSERIAYGSRIMRNGGVYLSPVYSGYIEPVVLSDSYGDVSFYMIPFIKPVNVEACMPGSRFDSYTDAMAAVVGQCGVDRSIRNVAVVHQFITNARVAGSERKTIGGLDNIDAGVFDSFDYVALGHLHCAQKCGSDKIRYSGTPLKYSFSEINDDKSVTIVDLANKGNVSVRTVGLTPLHEWRDVRGTFGELVAEASYRNNPYLDDYTRITLTDETDVVDALGKLRNIYTRLMELQYDNSRTRNAESFTDLCLQSHNKTPRDFVGGLFKYQNGKELSSEQSAYVNGLIAEIWGREQI